MAKDKTISCHVCGFKNAENAERCVSCGAKLEGLNAEYSAEDLARRRNQQETFQPKWVGISFGIYMVLQAIVLGLVPQVIHMFDPQGVPGIAVSAGMWFLGGIMVGWISPGKTFFEPAVGAILAVFPTVAYLMWATPQVPADRIAQLGTGFQASTMTYVVGGMVGVMVALFGAFLGERLQVMSGKRAAT